MSQDKTLKQSDIYLPCKDIKRQKADMTVSQELSDEIGSNYRTLPIFQKGLYDLTHRNHYSLQTNEHLKCRWSQYKQNIEGKVYAPFQFLEIRDYHFYNCRTQLVPAVSVHSKTNFRKSLKPGPGLDERGWRPIPQELLMKRSGGSKTCKKQQAKNVTKGKEKK